MKLLLKISVVVALLCLLGVFVYAYDFTATATTTCKEQWACNDKICTCGEEKQVCDSVSSKDNTCNAVIPEKVDFTTETGYKFPMECLREKGLCQVTLQKQYTLCNKGGCKIETLSWQDKKLFLEENNCDRTKNPFCELEYLNEIK